MAERIREVKITVEIDTNKRTITRTVVWELDETIGELQTRVLTAINDAYEEAGNG